MTSVLHDDGSAAGSAFVFNRLGDDVITAGFDVQRRSTHIRYIPPTSSLSIDVLIIGLIDFEHRKWHDYFEPLHSTRSANVVLHIGFVL